MSTSDVEWLGACSLIQCCTIGYGMYIIYHQGGLRKSYSHYLTISIDFWPI